MTATTATTALPRSTDDTATSVGFFAHHGIWAPGVRLFRSLRFAAKALIISLAFVVPLVCWAGTELWKHAGRRCSRAWTPRASTWRWRMACSTWAHAQEAAGTLTREQAQAMAKKAVAALRYDGNEYFWINDMQPRVVMHPIKPELDGQATSAT
jgi:methyl-accepting chemotaxis protein